MSSKKLLPPNIIYLPSWWRWEHYWWWRLWLRMHAHGRCIYNTSDKDIDVSWGMSAEVVTFHLTLHRWKFVSWLLVGLGTVESFSWLLCCEARICFINMVVSTNRASLVRLAMPFWMVELLQAGQDAFLEILLPQGIGLGIVLKRVPWRLLDCLRGAYDLVCVTLDSPVLHLFSHFLLLLCQLS